MDTTTKEAPLALTPEQRIVLSWIVVLLAERKKAGEAGLRVTTASLTKVTGRVGQVVGLLCSNLVAKGLLAKAGAASYKLTLAGLEQWEAEHPKETRTT